MEKVSEDQQKNEQAEHFDRAMTDITGLMGHFKYKIRLQEELTWTWYEPISEVLQQQVSQKVQDVFDSFDTIEASSFVVTFDARDDTISTMKVDFDIMQKDGVRVQDFYSGPVDLDEDMKPRNPMAR